ncbi:MAG: DNA repair protein RecO [Saprospiraceae bacterium]|nr:DNA repair protein RecO [Saprospiraceae bacterium]
MLTTVHGIVIRSLKYSESSIIFDALTAEHGVQSFIVGGVRKKKAKMPAAIFQLMSLVEVVAYIKNNDSLNRVKEARLTDHYQLLPYDPIRRSIGTFMAEVLQKTMESPEENRTLFDFVKGAFLILDQKESNIRDQHLYFLIRLSKFLGFYPDGQWSSIDRFFHLAQGKFLPAADGTQCLSEQRSMCLSRYLESERDTTPVESIDRQSRKDLLDDLLQFYAYHLDHFRSIQSHRIFAELLE